MTHDIPVRSHLPIDQAEEHIGDRFRRHLDTLLGPEALSRLAP
jgi:hypothetical protein